MKEKGQSSLVSNIDFTKFYSNLNFTLEKTQGTVGQFIAELCKLSEHCEFGDTLHDMLRDRLACGSKGSPLQCKLLAKFDLAFEKEFKQTKAMETAEQDSKSL